jgi:hypothetical protein
MPVLVRALPDAPRRSGCQDYQEDHPHQTMVTHPIRYSILGCTALQVSRTRWEALTLPLSLSPVVTRPVPKPPGLNRDERRIRRDREMKGNSSKELLIDELKDRHFLYLHNYDRLAINRWFYAQKCKF